MASDLDGLGKVVESSPWKVVATGLMVFTAGALLGACVLCTPSRYDRGRPPLGLRVDAQGMPDWPIVGPAVGIMLALSLGIAILSVYALRRSFRVELEHAGARLRRLGETRFVPYSGISSVGAEGTKLALLVGSGPAFRIDTGMRAKQDVRELRDEIIRRMQKDRYELPSPSPGGDAEALLDPGGRSMADWLRVALEADRERNGVWCVR